MEARERRCVDDKVRRDSSSSNSRRSSHRLTNSIQEAGNLRDTAGTDRP